LFDATTAEDLAALLGWAILSVPQSAKNVGMMNVAHFKPHQHLIVDFG
jgi:hypothetical protein